MHDVWRVDNRGRGKASLAIDLARRIPQHRAMRSGAAQNTLRTGPSRNTGD